MIRRMFMCAAVATVMTLPAIGQTPAAQTAAPQASAAPSLDDIVAKHVKAMGGAEKWNAVKAIRTTGKLTTPNGMDIPITSAQERPNKERQEATFQGMTQVQVFDGSNGYVINPFQGKKDPEPMAEEDKTEMSEDYIDGPLANAASKGIKLEYLGKEPVEGSDTFKIKATMKSGNVQTVYLDTDSYLPVKVETKRFVRGSEREMETTLGDYKEVEGLTLPYSVEQGPKNSQQKMKISVVKYEINPQLDATLFAVPANMSTAAPAEKKEPAKDDKKPATAEPKKDK